MLVRSLFRGAKSCIRGMGTFSVDRGRFYKDVSVEETPKGFQVKLDKYNLRTPLKERLYLPTEGLANAVAVEWDSMKENIVPVLMPVSQLCFKATDRPIPDEELVEHMLDFLTTDTICYRAPPSEEKLYEVENGRWNPITQWFSEHYHVHLAMTTDIMLTPQPQQTTDKMRARLQQLHPWSVPCYHHSTITLKSFVIAMAIMEGGLAVDEATICSNLETDFQIENWGEVEWVHGLDRARTTADIAAAVLVHNEILSLTKDTAQQFTSS